jgi:hypothetical protein
MASMGTSGLWEMTEQDPIQLELVMQLVVICSDAESIGGSADSKDGRRSEVYPIIGGRFEGKTIRGTVLAGGGDFPVVRPDGVQALDALYRLKTDDGVIVIIHNKGLTYPAVDSAKEYDRLVPEFIAPQGKYGWLNSNIFLATLTDTPLSMRLAQGPHENDRLIQVYRVY